MTRTAELAREYLFAWNDRDFGHQREMLADDCVFVMADGTKLEGADATLEAGKMWAAAFPDGRIEEIRLYEADGEVTIECVGRGTHTGELMGIAPTGKQVQIPFCEVLEVRDGKVCSEHQYLDMLTILQQLGVAPVAANN